MFYYMLSIFIIFVIYSYILKTFKILELVFSILYDLLYLLHGSLEEHFDERDSVFK